MAGRRALVKSLEDDVDALKEDFRHAMRRLATTIALVTTGRGENRAGIAATTVSSVAAAPPTLLVVVNRSASIFPVLHDEAQFCVNLLAGRQSSLVQVFGGGKKGTARFEAGAWAESAEGLPVLMDAAASIICRTTATLDVATHRLFVGEVTRIEVHASIDPLIWLDGQLARAERLAQCSAQS